MTLNQLLKEWEEIAISHQQINSFGFGSLFDITTSGDINYPLMWVKIDNVLINERVEIYNFDIILMDVVKGGRVNETEVLSDQLLILKDVVSQIQHPDYEWLHEANNINAEPFTERFTDSVSGWVANLSLQLPFLANRCQIPYTYINNDTISTSVNCGIKYFPSGWN